MDHLIELIAELKGLAQPEKVSGVARFFKTNPGEYGEGDQFIGITVPEQRAVAKKYARLVGRDEIEILLRDPVHEYRQTALFMMVYQYEKTTDDPGRRALVDLYLRNLPYINNWDLVDCSADKIIGAYLFDKERRLLYELVESGRLWSQRVAIIATFYFIKQGQFQDTLAIAGQLLQHKHDLIHKAVGWMLREVGKRDLQAELEFLDANFRGMPRTMLRYAIEKFEPELRDKYMKG